MVKRKFPLSKVYGLLEPGPVVLLTTAQKGRANIMAVGIDAETGEIYSGIGGDQFEAAPSSTHERRPTEWDGGFDEKSKAAVFGRSNYAAWWPRAYPSTQLPAQPGELVYVVHNRKLLRTALEHEMSKQTRDAQSWATSGVIRVALGDWTAALDDLKRSVEVEPTNSTFRYYRGLIFALTRDFEASTAEFKLLPASDERLQQSASAMMGVLKGNQESKFNSEVMVFETNIGQVPIHLQLGPIATRLDR